MREKLIETIRDVLDYNPETGVFLRKKTTGPRARKGSFPGGAPDKNGYIKIGLLGERYYAHRLAWAIVYGEFPEFQIDHKNGVRSDNRISNLRAATSAENAQNRAKNPNFPKEKPVGVCYDNRRNRWIAYVTVCGKKFYAYRKTEEEAIKARISLKKMHHVFQPVERDQQLADLRPTPPCGVAAALCLGAPSGRPAFFDHEISSNPHPRKESHHV